MNTPVREGETIEGSRTMRNRPYPVLKCSSAQVRVVAEPASVRRRRALRAGARRTTPLAAGRRHSLPRTKLVRIVSRPPTTTPGSTSPLDPPRRTTSPRPAHRLTCVDLVPAGPGTTHSLQHLCSSHDLPGEGSCICLSHSIAFVLILSRVDLTKESSRLGLPVRTVSKKEENAHPARAGSIED